MTDEPMEIHNPFFHDYSADSKSNSIESPSFTSSSEMTSSPSPTATASVHDLAAVAAGGGHLGRKISYK